MARVAGIIFRAGDPRVTAQFYADLGLSTNEHQHGGPVHHEIGPFTEKSVLEVYQASQRYGTDALMVEVASIEAALKQVSILEPVSVIDGHDMRFTYIRDPDGRSVMLIEKK